MDVNDEKLKKYNELRETVPLLSPERAKLFYETMYVCDMVLTKFGIEYSLTGGTLLGQLRHGGMIPWDDDLDVMVFNPHQSKMFETEVVREFNKYGFNVFMECHGKYNKECDDSFVNHIYKETYLGSVESVTEEVFKIKSSTWMAKSNPTKYNAGNKFHDSAVLDFFPHNLYQENKWRPKWTPYFKGDKDVLTTDEIWPLKRAKFGTFEVSIINKPPEYVERWAGKNFMDTPKWTHSHTIKATSKHKEYIATNAELFKNLELPCLFDPTQL
jgi:phosphorylcholine metabolism protein LicD